MHLDVQTLSVVTVFITALLGALLVFAGLQNRSIRAPMWWGAAHIVNAVGLGLLMSGAAAPRFLSVDAGNALVLLGYGLTWTGARVFDDRTIRASLVLLAPLGWLLLCRLPGFAADLSLRTIIVSTLLALLALLTAEEFWRGRDEPLMSRWPSVIVLLAYAAALLARVPATLLSPAFASDSLLSGLSFALLAFGTLLFTVVMAFLQLNMTKERTERRHMINSLVDPLSGVANRRAFLDGAAALLAQQEIDHEPLAVMLFDLDHFKQINDRFGHAVGDTVLQTFAGTATATLGADVLVRPDRRRGVCVLHAGWRSRRGFRGGRAGEAKLSSAAARASAPPELVSERERRRDARLRSAGQGSGSADGGRSGAASRQGTRPQPRRDGIPAGPRRSPRGSVDRPDHWPRAYQLRNGDMAALARGVLTGTRQESRAKEFAIARFIAAIFGKIFNSVIFAAFHKNPRRASNTWQRLNPQTLRRDPESRCYVVLPD